jgi:hypothetical protein
MYYFNGVKGKSANGILLISKKTRLAAASYPRL